MNRREFLKGTKKSASAIVSGAGPGVYEGPWTQNEVTHLLKRTMFGARREEVEYFLGLGVNDAVDELLSGTRSVSPPLRDYGLIDDVNGPVDDPGCIQGQSWVNNFNTIDNPITRSIINGQRIMSLQKWWAGLIIHQQRTIEEKMVLFWHHHFSVQKEEVNNANHLYTHHMLLRNNVLGNVRELTKKVTIDAAMLVHLNGYLNSKRAPDENYARELQELMTVGKGDDSLYTEEDVREAARVLTGWRINPDTFETYCEESLHDTGVKKFSSFYNNATISGGNGQAEMEQLINMIFATPECSKFICRKLYKWFVYYSIDEETEATIIHPLAEIFRESNFEIKPVLSALLKSEHFFHKSRQACYIKSPFDFMVGALREFNVSFPDYNDYQNGYPLFFSLLRKGAEMQQELFQPPDVSGWPSYYQEPVFYELWVNSNTLPRRAMFTDELVDQNIIDIQAFISDLSNISDSDTVIDEITGRLLRYPLSHTSKTYLKMNILTDTGADNIKKLIRFLLNLPEYHLC